MKVVTREYEVYSFEELDAEAKEKVKSWYLDDETRVDMLAEIYEKKLRIVDDDLKEICDCNNWHFLKDGTFFVE